MPSRDHRAVSRRQVLGYGLGALAATPLLSRLVAADDGAAIRNAGKAKHVIILFMNGGASQFETFDPKPGTPGGGPTRAIPTAVPGIRIAAGLPLLAKQMDKICLVRSMSTREGNHARARYLMRTGYAKTPTVVHPCTGSMLSHEIGDPEAALPNYVAIGGQGGKPGFLGAAHAPLSLRLGRTKAGRKQKRGKSKIPLKNVRLPKGLTTARRDQRLDFLDQLNEGFASEHGSAATEAQEAMFQRAARLLDSPDKTAFDSGLESRATRDRYGPGPFGRGCLLARRLVGAGVACVEVNLDGWDTHTDNFSRVKALNADMDRGAAALLEDLRSNGKLDETLVIWIGDFGRKSNISSTQGRGHQPSAWSAWLAGGGVQGGRVIGATDKNGDTITRRPVSETDLFASLAHATGVDKDKVFYSRGRPISLVYETGKVVPEFFEA